MRDPLKSLFFLALAATALSACAAALSACAEAQNPYAEYAEWTVESALRIGDPDDPAFAFDFVGDLAVGSDGTIFTAHPRESLIRRWTPDGAAAGRIGGPGEGAGEFSTTGCASSTRSSSTRNCPDTRPSRRTRQESG